MTFKKCDYIGKNRLTFGKDPNSLLRPMGAHLPLAAGKFTQLIGQ